MKVPHGVAGTASQKHRLILDKKTTTPLPELCRGCPVEFQEFISSRTAFIDRALDAFVVVEKLFDNGPNLALKPPRSWASFSASLALRVEISCANLLVASMSSFLAAMALTSAFSARIVIASFAFSELSKQRKAQGLLSPND